MTLGIALKSPKQPPGSYTALTKQQPTPTRPSLAPHTDHFAVVVTSLVAEFFSLIRIPTPQSTSTFWIRDPSRRAKRKDAGRKNCSPNGIHSPVLVKVRADASIQGHGHVSATIVIGSQPCQQDHQAGWGDSQLKGLLECSFK